MFASCWPGGAVLTNEPGAPSQLTCEELRDAYQACLAANDGRLILHGLFARADAATNNNRSYPYAALAREVKRYRRRCVARGAALGELEHPSYSSKHFGAVSLANVSHQVLHLAWRGRELRGCIEVLPTPSGLLAWELCRRGARLGLSTRSWGSVEGPPPPSSSAGASGGGGGENGSGNGGGENGGSGGGSGGGSSETGGKSGKSGGGDAVARRVGKDMVLLTFDLVADPAHPDALLAPLPRRFRGRVPAQLRAVQLAHIGVGSCRADAAEALPDARAVWRVLAQLRARAAAVEAEAERRRLASPTPPAATVVASNSSVEHKQQQQQQQQQQQKSMTGLQAPPLAAMAPGTQSMLRAPPAAAVLAAPPPPAAAAERAAAGPHNHHLTLPASAAMPGGTMRLASHYTARPEPDHDAFLPRDPAGRSLAKHHGGVAAAVLAAAEARGRPVGDGGARYEAERALEAAGALRERWRRGVESALAAALEEEEEARAFGVL